MLSNHSHAAMSLLQIKGATISLRDDGYITNLKYSRNSFLSIVKQDRVWNVVKFMRS